MSTRPAAEISTSYTLPRKPLRVASRQLPPTLRSSRHRFDRPDDRRPNHHAARQATPKNGRRLASAWTICPQSDSTIDKSSEETSRASAKLKSAGLFVFSVNQEESLEMRQAIEKCMRWVEGLPDKFSGLNDLLPPVNYDVKAEPQN